MWYGWFCKMPLARKQVKQNEWQGKGRILTRLVIERLGTDVKGSYSPWYSPCNPWAHRISWGLLRNAKLQGPLCIRPTNVNINIYISIINNFNIYIQGEGDSQLPLARIHSTISLSNQDVVILLLTLHSSSLPWFSRTPLPTDSLSLNFPAKEENYPQIVGFGTKI